MHLGRFLHFSQKVVGVTLILDSRRISRGIGQEIPRKAKQLKRAVLINLNFRY